MDTRTRWRARDAGNGSKGRAQFSYGIERLQDQAEFRNVERLARRGSFALDTLSLAAARKLEHPVVAIRIVAGPRKETERCPRAAAAALLGVITSLAESPQIGRAT